ncbi:MAG TPA: glycosyltransferase family 1 protein [Bryobacteraceae bacterium]|nr:glycosyltransferase family 1 protein [Bryobacteraceae bacterium]
MRIAVDVRRIRDFGVGTYIRNLLHALARVSDDHEYCLICSPEDSVLLADLPPTFRPITYRRRDSSLWDHIELPGLLRRLGAAITHIPFHRVPLPMPRPYVVTVHDLGSLFFDDAAGVHHAAREYRLKRGLLRASRIIAVSGATQRDVSNLVPEVSGKIRLIYNAPDPQFLERRDSSDDRSRILERYQIRYPFLLYAGSIRPQKNIPRLIEAFAVARSSLEQYPAWKDLRLIIIGDEISRHPNVRRAVIHSRVENCVRFLGFIPFDTLRIFYEQAQAFVFPSLYEGFGLGPLEAMASGTPVISSAAASLPEVVGGAAMLVNPENVFDISRGIIEVLTNDALRQDMVLKGRRQAASFSWNRTAREVLEVYKAAAR